MRSLIWRWEAFAKKRQIKNHAKLTSYTVLTIGFNPRDAVLFAFGVYVNS